MHSYTHLKMVILINIVICVAFAYVLFVRVTFTYMKPFLCKRQMILKRVSFPLGSLKRMTMKKREGNIKHEAD